MAAKKISVETVLELFRELPASAKVSALTALGTSSSLVWAGTAAAGMWKVHQEVSSHRWFWEDHVISGLAKLNELGMLTNPEIYAPSFALLSNGAQRYLHRSDWYSNKLIFPQTGQKLHRPSKIKNAPPLVYVALGDSAAQGVGCEDVHDSYVALFASYLRRATQRRVIVLNYSISGAVASTVVNAQIPQMLATGLTPDIITLDIGGNDVFSAEGQNPKNFQRQMEIIVESLPAPALISEVPPAKPLPADKRAIEMNDILTRVVSESDHILVPIRHLGDVPLWRTLMIRAEDGFHPNTDTYRQIAAEFVRMVEPLLQKRGWWQDSTADKIPPLPDETEDNRANLWSGLLKLKSADKGDIPPNEK
ncbi:SGNH/GDSL hydrolase family protein [Mobiluncus curtisii]|uniref:SGNH/GDSL hydrolase family protein n=1 Tax=Mobiluncus curtisii TaxID=2051 RepID=UPI0001E0A50A|nr:SGNH/GDSL hydrolase family protein [Mobiluncus curtisii]EFL94450.1 GDSL-like protein [Mobiluncus curtisii subsp. curtisii ATCC 35241]QQT13322.1 SGNH/GDSL hydrolase family protein [Mobiluncus curtisii]STY77026.1 GDSL-like Lipase/Acylhydrolase [Mobiluncus curtisii subsp. curtisii]